MYVHIDAYLKLEKIGGIYSIYCIYMIYAYDLFIFDVYLPSWIVVVYCIYVKLWPSPKFGRQ